MIPVGPHDASCPRDGQNDRVFCAHLVSSIESILAQESAASQGPGSSTIGHVEARSTSCKSRGLDMRRTLVNRCLIVLAVILGLSAALPFADTAARPGNGNSPNAKACQKGGWETRARKESPTVAFQSQDECVSYGAQGGTLVTVVAPTPSITVTMRSLEELCEPNILATGLAPGATYGFVGYIGYVGSEQESHRGEVSTDTTGAVSFSGTQFFNGGGYTYRVVIGGMSSASVSYMC